MKKREALEREERVYKFSLAFYHVVIGLGLAFILKGMSDTFDMMYELQEIPLLLGIFVFYSVISGIFFAVTFMIGLIQQTHERHREEMKRINLEESDF